MHFQTTTVMKMLYRLKPAFIDNTTYFIIFRTSENAFFSLIFLLHWWLCAVSGGHLEKIDIRVALSWHFGKSFSTKFHKTLNNFMNNLDTDRVRFAKIAGPANMPWVFFSAQRWFWGILKDTDSWCFFRPRRDGSIISIFGALLHAQPSVQGFWPYRFFK